jgi:hypothetical protein
MKRDRAMTIHFMDGTHVSFDFPAQKANDAARSILLDEVLKNPYVLVEAEGALLMYPVANIRSIQLTNLSGDTLTMAPKGLIRGARIIT